MLNLFTVYELDTWSRDLNTDFTLKDCLSGAVKVTKNADPDKYAYSGHGIGFNLLSGLSLSDSSIGKNVIIFAVDMNSTVHVDNKKKDILIIGKGLTQGLDDTMLKQELNIQLIMGATVSCLLML